jgi:hypothetical protein
VAKLTSPRPKKIICAGYLQNQKSRFRFAVELPQKVFVEHKIKPFSIMKHFNEQSSYGWVLSFPKDRNDLANASVLAVDDEDWAISYANDKNQSQNKSEYIVTDNYSVMKAFCKTFGKNSNDYIPFN